jgi:nucleosome binding factor SPN SPT16 subunit
MNGLQFRSTRGETVDIIFSNIKQAVFIPCEGEHLVLIHFHLKHPILVGKKKFQDLQFFTEAVESSMALDGRGRSDYDPDELGDEEKQNKYRADLNRAYRAFVQRVESAARADANVDLSFDIPPRDYSFAGTPFKEMTNVYLGASCIAAVVDKPPLVCPIADIEHVHFERVFHGSKSFDMVVIFKAGVAEKGQPEYVRITSIEMRHLEMIKEWLDELAEVTFTEGPASLRWDTFIPDYVRKDDFYLSEDEDGEKKPVGFSVFSLDSDSEDDEEDDDDEYESDEDESEEEEEDEDDDDDYASEDESESDYEDEDEDDEEDDWDELERKALEEERRKGRRYEEDEDDDRGKKGSKGGSSKDKGASSSKSEKPPKKRAKY